MIHARSGRRGLHLVLAAGLLALAAAVSAPAAMAAAPGNDNFAGATTLSGASFSQAGTTLEATMEMGEPDHAGASFDGTLGTDCDTTFDAQCEHSVWYSWTAPSNMTLNLQTCASDYDTTLAVYTGTLGALTEKASNDDTLGENDVCGEGDGAGLGSALSFNVASGSVYKIAVAGYEGDSGNFTLTTAAVPQAPPPVVTPPVVTPPVIPPAATTGQKKHHHKHHHKKHKHHHHHHHG